MLCQHTMQPRWRPCAASGAAAKMTFHGLHELGGELAAERLVLRSGKPPSMCRREANSQVSRVGEDSVIIALVGPHGVPPGEPDQTSAGSCACRVGFRCRDPLGFVFRQVGLRSIRPLQHDPSSGARVPVHPRGLPHLAGLRAVWVPLTFTDEDHPEPST